MPLWTKQAIPCRFNRLNLLLKKFANDISVRLSYVCSRFNLSRRELCSANPCFKKVFCRLSINNKNVRNTYKYFPIQSIYNSRWTESIRPLRLYFLDSRRFWQNLITSVEVKIPQSVPLWVTGRQLIFLDTIIDTATQSSVCQ